MTESIKSPQRLLSLDAFRGFTIAAMILVNDPGDWGHIYRPLEHAAWNGLTPTDLIFPFFLFIVGISIVFAYTKRIESGAKPTGLYKKIIFRSLKIFAVGVFLYLFPDFNFSEMRIAGVLQRIAVVFLICSILFLNTNWKTQSIIGAILLLAYWLAMTLIPTPGFDRVMFEPGANLAAWVDSILLPGRMWNKTWDPEGLLSTVPAIATGISGMLAGKILISKMETDRKIIWLFTGGFIFYIIGIMWGWVFPLNKNLWTSSYVMVTSGLGSMTLATCIYFIDVLKYNRIAQFGIIYGSNAITVYALASLLSPVFYGIPFVGYSLNVHFTTALNSAGFSPEFSSMLYAILYVGIIFIPALILYRKKIFIKL